MLHLPALIQDLAIILVTAGIVTLLFRRFRQPVVLGYIVAGFLVGKHVPIFPTIRDPANIRIWAEMGVIFVLFGLGLEFSFKKLVHVGGKASLTACFEVPIMVLLGFVTGRLLGWSPINSLFLGGIVAISSTTIIVRAIDEAGARGRGFVNLVLGVLVVEDLIAILLLVLLTTISISQTFVGKELFLALFKLGFFLVLWFLAGIFLLPTWLHRVRRHLTEETLLMVALGLCFIMVILTTRAGFSPALGAFIMGSILAETHQGKQIEHVVRPVKDLFAAIFFVSVGMLIDPQLLLQHALPIIVITLVTIFGKSLATTVGVLLAGGQLRHAVQSGVSLAQIGEFSFIIATLGLSLKVTSDFLYPVAVGVSAATTFTAPYLIRNADHIYDFIERHLPARLRRTLADYEEAARNLSFASDWWTLMRAYALRVIVNVVLIATSFTVVSQFIVPLLRERLQRGALANVLGVAISALISAPFFWALVMGRSRDDAVQRILADRRKKILLMLWEVFRWVIALALFATLSAQFISVKLSLLLALTAGVLILVFFSRHFERLYARLESQFVKNLNAKDATAQMPPMAPWDAHLAALDIDPNVEVVGKTLEQLRIREQFGVTVALIERAGRNIPAPNRHEMLFPYDRIFVIGTDEQIVRFREYLERATEPAAKTHEIEEYNYALEPYHVDANSPYCGRTIRDSGIREASQGLIVGIERRGKRILNPDSSLTIEPEDLLWIVGDREAIRKLHPQPDSAA